jgi:SAM-dependent methyltransferase
VPADAFGEDYLYFYKSLLNDELSDSQTELLWNILELSPGDEVLDVPCGHGRIANRLAARGARVTGFDADSFFLERAREQAVDRGVEVEYVHGDMRELPWAERFDAAVRLAIDVHSRDVFMRNRVPSSVFERDGDLVVDEHSFDVETGREETERWLIRDGATRKTGFSVRFYTYTELRDLLLGAGFSSVRGVGHDGRPLTLESRRMIVIATR